MLESGAMMMYLAEKTGKLMPQSKAEKYEVIQWLMFQMGGVGPMFGQFSHFVHYAPEKIDYAVERYTNECQRLCRVLDKQLVGNEFLVSNEYTIADISNYAWVHIHERLKLDISEFENVLKWLDKIGERPAVQKGVTLLTELRKEAKPDAETLKNYFGNAQYERR